MTAPGAWFLLLFPVFVLLYSVATLLSGKRTGEQQDQKPPSPPALPILGHIHLVGSLPHVSFGTLAKKHGLDLMMLRLGTMPMLVVTSPRVAEAVLRTHDLVFASRPSALATEIIMYGPSNIGFMPYSEYWRQAKKIVTTHLLNVNKVRSFRQAREEEVSMVMAQISEAAAAGTTMDMSELLGSFTNDVACRAVMGRYFRNESGRYTQLRELISDTSPLIGGFNVEEFFPFLARFGVLSKAEYDLTREHIKALLLDVFFGGIETSASTLDFTMAELMRRPGVMRKLQAEVRSRVPEGQELVTGADLDDMPYLRAVIKESLRLHPVTPLLAPHFSTKSCSIDGFAVPAKVRVVINAWAISRDERFWEDAEEFVPERFLDGGSAAEINFKGNDFRFLPFSSGRRMCPGMNFAMANIEVMLANLIHRFDWELPLGQERHDIDMTEVFGIVVHRKQKLLLVPKLRV
ncbi:hypothetical protein PR202_gb15698 [Eleusine coracana subsp. coracana]|uniref:Uncharacterized protein n=1 Tax=Eleusine coracana subsp. coracana TaxID=191504 RepID=A0AAV5EYN6_ELECO|nr:hypothetical protein QOZ80_4BG0349330 [Eleusine coracana subsp. coracana]GJN27657.1 hypothetical protein PR202_gb15698 [Eleusine coracana subsp. coracana]